METLLIVGAIEYNQRDYDDRRYIYYGYNNI